jgi:hypothetical protein
MTLVAYVPIWGNDFIDYDDENLIIGNRHLVGGFTPENVDWAWTNHEAPYRMPLVWHSFQLDGLVRSGSEAQAGKDSAFSPAVFHGQNLFWHLCNVQLLFGLLLRLTHLPWRSFLAAALFAVHPMHVESVAWAIERKDVLMCFFGLLSLRAYAWYVEKKSKPAYALMLLAFLGSLLCKPMLLTFPALLVLVDYWPLCRFQVRAAPGRKRSPLGPLVLEKLPVLAFAFIVGMLSLMGSHVRTMEDLGLVERLMNALNGYGCYLWKTAWPTDLAILYPHLGLHWSLLLSLRGAVLLLAGTAGSLALVERCRWCAVGWFWFVGTLVPVIGLTQGGVQSWADRFSYWPHIGLFIAVAWGSTALAGRLGLSRAAGAAWVVVLGVLMTMTWVQVGYWKSSCTVWQHALDVTEDNDRAHERLAICLSRQGRGEEASALRSEAVRIQRRRILPR